MKKLLILVLISAACTPVYLPNSRSVPTFDDGGQVSLDGYISGSGFDLNSGISVSKHVAVIGNISYSQRDDVDSENYHKHKFGEIGLGYFDSVNDKFQLGYFGGYGMGEGTNVDNYVFFTQNTERTTGYYNRGFLQANFVFTPGVMKIGAAFRMSYVNFYKFETNASSYNQDRSATFFEPAFFMKVGDPINFNFQGGFNLPMQDNIAFDYRILHLTIGFGVKIGGKNKNETD